MYSVLSFSRAGGGMQPPFDLLDISVTDLDGPSTPPLPVEL